MSFKLKNLNTVHRFQSKYDEHKGTDQAVTFLIRTLSRKEVAHIRTIHRSDIYAITIAAQSGKELVLGSEDLEMELFRIGVCGWENLNDENGKPVEFKLDPKSAIPAVHPDLIDMFPTPLIEEIANDAVWKHNLMDVTTGKN